MCQLVPGCTLANIHIIMSELRIHAQKSTELQAAFTSSNQSGQMFTYAVMHVCVWTLPYRIVPVSRTIFGENTYPARLTLLIIANWTGPCSFCTRQGQTLDCKRWINRSRSGGWDYTPRAKSDTYDCLVDVCSITDQ